MLLVLPAAWPAYGRLLQDSLKCGSNRSVHDADRMSRVEITVNTRPALYSLQSTLASTTSFALPLCWLTLCALHPWLKPQRLFAPPPGKSGAPSCPHQATLTFTFTAAGTPVDSVGIAPRSDESPRTTSLATVAQWSETSYFSPIAIHGRS